MKFYVNDSKKAIVDLEFDELNEIYIKDIDLYIVIVSRIFNEIDKMENVINISEMDESFEYYISEVDINTVINTIDLLVVPLAIDTIDKKIKYLNLLHKDNSDIPIPIPIDELLKIKENLI